MKRQKQSTDMSTCGGGGSSSTCSRRSRCSRCSKRRNAIFLKSTSFFYFHQNYLFRLRRRWHLVHFDFLVVVFFFFFFFFVFFLQEEQDFFFFFLHEEHDFFFPDLEEDLFTFIFARFFDFELELLFFLEGSALGRAAAMGAGSGFGPFAIARASLFATAIASTSDLSDISTTFKQNQNMKNIFFISI